jgi:hypothetical protein
MPTSWVPRGAKVDPKWVQSVRASGFLARPRAPSDGAPTPRGWACHPEITLLQPSALPLVRAFLGYGITNTYCIGSTRHVFEDIYVPCVTIFVYIHTTLPVLVYSSGSGFDGTALARFLLVLSMALLRFGYPLRKAVVAEQRVAKDLLHGLLPRRERACFRDNGLGSHLDRTRARRLLALLADTLLLAV